MASSSDDYLFPDHLFPDRPSCAACEVQFASGSDYGREHTCGSDYGREHTSGSDYGREHGRRRANHDSIAWERIPERTVCICAHPKAVHTAYGYPPLASYALKRPPEPNKWICGGPRGSDNQAAATHSCHCPGFHDVDHRMPRDAFAERLLSEFSGAFIKGTPNTQARARAALLWAWKQSGLDLHEPRTWALWMHESKRVWRAWRDAGSPIHAFGKETSFGVASIPALEDR